MHKLLHTLSVKDFPTIPTGWHLSYDELSGRCYHVRLAGQHGPVVEHKGEAEVAELVTRCMEDAVHIDKQLQERHDI